MKRAYKIWKPNSSTKETLDHAVKLLNHYAGQGYTLTLRQLYYQLVKRNLIVNEDKQYKRLSEICTNGRMGGYIDWSHIEDRLRQPYVPYWAHDSGDAINDTLTHFRVNRQLDQPSKIEVWIEKDALSSVAKRVTEKYHIRLMVNRGYSSCSAMKKAAERLDNDSIILYCGDHDPSGLDMIRDIGNRLNEFGVFPTVTPIALLMEQINEYELPPNPAKLSDSRAPSYVAEFGLDSWELDALEPNVLEEIIEKNILKVMNIGIYNEQMEREKEEREKLDMFQQLSTLDLETFQEIIDNYL